MRQQLRIRGCHAEVPQICDELVEYSSSKPQSLICALHYQRLIKLETRSLTYCGIVHDDHHVCIPCQFVKDSGEIIHLHL